MIGGTANISIERSITGISITNDELIPVCKNVFSTGIANGLIVIAIPQTKIILNRLAPITFPSDKLLWPFAKEVIAVTSSGSEVPKAINVRAITDSGTPSHSAILVPLSTNSFAPTAISAAPTTSKTMSSQSLVSFFFSFSSPLSLTSTSSGSTSSLFLIVDLIYINIYELIFIIT